jgi:hypothetical protein
MFEFEDTPLFSGTPIKVTESIFTARPAEKQMILGSCSVCLDTGVCMVNGKARYCSCDQGQAAQRRKALLSDCRSLSGSTMGTLTGLRLYDDIDAVQAEFTQWVSDPAQPEFKNWQEAWAAFSNNGQRKFESTKKE